MMAHVEDGRYMSLELERSRTRNEYTLLETSPSLVVFSNSFVKSFGFTNIHSFFEGFLLLNGYGPRGRDALWICTLGERGSIAAVVSRSEIKQFFHCPAAAHIDVFQGGVVDTLGAGDAFLAGLVVAIGITPIHFDAAAVAIVTYATNTAGEKIQTFGLL